MQNYLFLDSTFDEMKNWWFILPFVLFLLLNLFFLVSKKQHAGLNYEKFIFEKNKPASNF